MFLQVLLVGKVGRVDYILLMTQPRDLEPLEAKGQRKKKYSSVPDLGLLLYCL